ncbi:unnamed protein product, partial [Oikopleura dioica]
LQYNTVNIESYVLAFLPKKSLNTIPTGHKHCPLLLKTRRDTVSSKVAQSKLPFYRFFSTGSCSTMEEAPVCVTDTSSEIVKEEQPSKIEIEVVANGEEKVTCRKPEILKVHSCHVFQLRPGEKPSLTESHVFSAPTSDVSPAPSSSLPKELIVKIEKVSDEENKDPLARLKAQAHENVKNNMSINAVEIKSVSELTRLTDKLFKYALDQKNVDGYNSIRCLVRRLRRSRCENPLDKLIQALRQLRPRLRTQSADSDCITIPKSQDGRIQVAKKKCYPHVLYVKLFRYDDVTHSTPLLSLCKFGRGSSEKVCVNPYHYEKAQTEAVTARY